MVISCHVLSFLRMRPKSFRGADGPTILELSVGNQRDWDGAYSLIEDDTAAAQSIELMSLNRSFTVYTTDLGEEGIHLGKIYDYDIILLDLNLPDVWF